MKTFFQFDSRIARATSFVEKLLEYTTASVIRCPYLANLELERRKQLHGKGNVDNLMEALVKYFLRYATIILCTIAYTLTIIFVAYTLIQ